ncbi:MAG TPA: hypothetical protein VL326_36435 [Kofleriaceae bacterium]|nr:hypothetical protein [Kofleriaceae bacterium]
MRWLTALLPATLAACSHAASIGSTTTLRTACPDHQFWDGSQCKPGGDAAAKLAAGTDALAKLDVDAAKAALDQVEAGGPLDHDANVRLWEQRGIAAAYTDDEATATTAFDMVLALDPAHFLSYELSPKATLVFEKALKASKARGAPEVDVSWPRGGKVGDAIPVDVEVLADPKHFLDRATLFVRTRGEPTWRAADLHLAAAAGTKLDKRVVLPPVAGTKPASLELYLRAYDANGNEVLTWADPTKPREIALRYEPPTPWYRTWWGIGAIGVGAAAVVGTIVYFTVVSPPDKIGGDVSVP